MPQVLLERSQAADAVELMNIGWQWLTGTSGPIAAGLIV